MKKICTRSISFLIAIVFIAYSFSGCNSYSDNCSDEMKHYVEKSINIIENYLNEDITLSNAMDNLKTYYYVAEKIYNEHETGDDNPYHSDYYASSIIKRAYWNLEMIDMGTVNIKEYREKLKDNLKDLKKYL